MTWREILKDETGGGSTGKLLPVIGVAIGIGLAVATGGASLALMPLGVAGTVAAAGLVGGAIGYLADQALGYVAELLMPDIPEISDSPTYASNQIGNTISEGIFEARCYGLCKIGGNKLRFNDAGAADLRVIVAHCMGPVEGISEWYVNDIAWGDLTGSHSKTEYTGTWAQTPDSRFTSRPSAYRGTAYTAFSFAKNDNQVGYDPTVTCLMQGLLCAPLAGGADAFTRNNAVILYDFYRNVEGKAAGVLDLNSFKSLEALCDEVPSGSSLPRYRFDFNFDVNMTINDAKKLLWQSFNGQVIMSQGKYKCVWDSSQMADGSGGLTAKTVSHAFTEDNIVKGSLTWSQPEPPNVVRIHFIDSTQSYQKTSVEARDENDIETSGEILYEETCYYITDPEIARRRAKFKFNKFKYENYQCKLTAFSGAGDLELYDLVTVTHTLPGWTEKQFLVAMKAENQYGQPAFLLKAYYPGVYDDSQVAYQPGYESDLPVPYKIDQDLTIDFAPVHEGMRLLESIGSAVNDDMSSFTDWTDADAGGGESTLVAAIPCAEFDYGNSDETIDREGTATLFFISFIDDPPYTWSVSGTGFYFDAGYTLTTITTTEKTVTLYADETACGMATITVAVPGPAACDDPITGYVRCTEGVWTLKGRKNSIVDDDIGICTLGCTCNTGTGNEDTIAGYQKWTVNCSGACRCNCTEARITWTTISGSPVDPPCGSPVDCNFGSVDNNSCPGTDPMCYASYYLYYEWECS